MRDLTRRRVAGLFATCVATAALGAPPATAAPAAKWAALGDSYTAGVFIGAPSPSLGSGERDGCDRTSGSYPDLVGRALSANPPSGRAVELTDVSCGGATVAEIGESRQTPISPVQPPADGWPAVAAQVERAELGVDTEVVTIGVGGNSLPVSTVLISCLVAGVGQPDDATPCRDAYESQGTFFDPESIHDKYDRVTREYAAMLQAVTFQAPGAELITVGYPTVFPDDPATCDRRDTTELAARVEGFGVLSATHGDIAWMREVLAHLNEIIEGVTELSGGTYVDAAGPSRGHDVCTSAAEKHVEGICGQAEDYWPAELPLGQFTLTCADGERATLVHPNAAGHATTAGAVEAAVRAALG
ncbi:SGNH/GDSL hydrolase family protein [Saccharothrix syringae]|uniref:SGNH/GDSL hydrolase family protein n=1 Tax=Saccharothrix syringae TaxID=103733 RepID=A0A5Q0H9X7_SACSY|nr:SGNH/GDSL hydrolase family protein [Saccharothrix syringae]QFZ23047.1 SGNH/GDSL hydrolase family protein [Saccharothrix syringae]